MMLKKYKKDVVLNIWSLFLLLILFLNTFHVKAQKIQTEVVRDLESWNSVGLAYKPTKKWAFELNQQIRFKQDASVIGAYFTEFETAYSITKNWEIAGGFRYIRENDNKGKIQGYNSLYRYQFDLKYQHDIKRFTLGYRLRYQSKSQMGVSASDLDAPTQNIRFKLDAEYNIKGSNFTPSIAVDFFNSVIESNLNLSKYRTTTGVDYKFKKLGKLGLFYLIDKQLRTDYPKTTHIISLKYLYTIK
jgi:hypothetical protein